MANANSVVANYSGVVAYKDNTNAVFHSQIEYHNAEELSWSIDQIASLITVGNLSADPAFQFDAVLPGYTFVDAVAPKAIRDAAFRLTFTMTTDDGREYPISVSCERVGGVFTTRYNIISAPPVLPSNYITYIMPALNRLVAILGGTPVP